MNLTNLKKDLRTVASPEKANVSKRFFKTEAGQYSAGDIFLGIAVGDTRKIAKKYCELALPEIKELLYSKIHEERLCALFILSMQFKKADDKKEKIIFDFYIKNAKQVNNWDLVDQSAPSIVGEYLLYKPRILLKKLARSKNIWEKRIAIITTFTFIRNNQLTDTFQIAEMLLSDEHDLIHKAVGWMLREAGKRDMKAEEKFLQKHYKKMPRTMLRYAIEKFPEVKRRKYLKGKI